MLISEDLRKGNLVRVDNDILEIYGVVDDKLYFKNGWNVVDWSIENAHPIKLNPSWIELFKFDESGWRNDIAVDFYLNEENMWYISYSEKGKVEIGVGYFIESGLEINHMKYVHQLQNLYRILNNKDIKYDKSKLSDFENKYKLLEIKN